MDFFKTNVRFYTANMMQDSVTGLTIFCIYLVKVSLRLKVPLQM